MARIRRSKRQSAWEYMRRNPTFLANDILIITGLSKLHLRLLIGELKKQKIVKQISTGRLPFEKKSFRVIGKTESVVCPIKTEKRNVKHVQH